MAHERREESAPLTVKEASSAFFEHNKEAHWVAIIGSTGEIYSSGLGSEYPSDSTIQSLETQVGEKLHFIGRPVSPEPMSVNATEPETPAPYSLFPDNGPSPNDLYGYRPNSF